MIRRFAERDDILNINSVFGIIPDEKTALFLLAVKFPNAGSILLMKEIGKSMQEKIRRVSWLQDY
jgi:hypothetical protein